MRGTQASSSSPPASPKPVVIGGDLAGLGDGCHTGKLKDSDGMLAGNVREIDQELIEGISRLDVVEQGLDWHPRSGEDWLSAEVLGRDCDQGLGQLAHG
jgi:hypothetical protein